MNNRPQDYIDRYSEKNYVLYGKAGHTAKTEPLHLFENVSAYFIIVSEFLYALDEVERSLGVVISCLVHRPCLSPPRQRYQAATALSKARHGSKR
jgi:hypothetical protein